MRLPVVALLLLAPTLVACPPEQKKAAPSSHDACTRIGDNCEVSPGKLGTCVVKDDCAPPSPCFTCQSQH